MPTLKEALSEKITSADQLLRICNQHLLTSDFGSILMSGRRVGRQWWAYREFLRITHGVYTITGPLEALNEQLPVYSHVSVEDPTRVSYTLDKSMGEQDRQIVTSLGKLLTKLYPAAQDHAIQLVVSDHMAELSDEVEWIQHGDIAAVYLSGKVGACMSKVDSAFVAGNPTEAYNAPGATMAVMRDSNGDINARCLVVDGKHYIRGYGDAQLVKRLDRLGLTPGGWFGFKFKTIPVPRELVCDDNWYVMPYLDGMNGMGSEAKSSVALIDGVITSVSLDYANKLRRLVTGCVATAVSTNGRVKLFNIESSRFSAVDYFTGNLISRFDSHIKLFVDNTEHITNELPLNFVLARTLINNTRETRHMRIEDTVECRNYSRYDAAHLESYDIVQLDAELYFGAVPKYIDRILTRTTISGKVITTGDSVLMLTDSGNMTVHRSELVTTGKTKHIKLSDAQWALPGTKLYLTPSGRKVHPLTHDVRMMYDGMYDFNRNIKSIRVMRKEFWVPKAPPVPLSTDEGSVLWNKAVAFTLTQFREEMIDSSVALGFGRMVNRLYTRVSCSSDFRSYDSFYNRTVIENSCSASVVVDRARIIAASIDSAEARFVLYAAETVYAEMNALECVDAPIASRNVVILEAAAEVAEVVPEVVPEVVSEAVIWDVVEQAYTGITTAASLEDAGLSHDQPVATTCALSTVTGRYPPAVNYTTLGGFTTATTSAATTAVTTSIQDLHNTLGIGSVVTRYIMSV